MKRDFQRWARRDARRQTFPKWQVFAARLLLLLIGLALAALTVKGLLTVSG